MIARFKILIRGVVQGVGFRPHVYQLASRFHLKGYVLNSSSGVTIEVEGGPQALEAFASAVADEAPPLARIESVAIERGLDPSGYTTFEIRESQARAGEWLLVSPDIATCDDCLGELFDSGDRRYRYPFINCTNCGPRFTIIEDIPYDRPLTTMKKFVMCPDCEAEYHDPANRRFHAQPNACPVCGPSVQLWGLAGDRTAGGTPAGDAATAGFAPLAASDPMGETISRLSQGDTVAIKGLGGFHLACDATSEHAVARLRDRKKRFGKPLAVMVADLDSARRLCEVGGEEARLLTSRQRPIVLLKMHTSSPVARNVAPGNNFLGVMLPYTPLHHVLLRESGMILVMTSGNLSEEPIAMENEEALRRLGALTDYFLMHNRDIHSRYDDSVTRVDHGRPTMIRRARSFAPYPLHLPFAAGQILAVGPELKNTFCLTKENFAFVSQHIGDLENLETLEHFEATLALYKKLFRIEPEVVAYDLHPEYLSTKYALELGRKSPDLNLVGVQHHHAHIAGCLAENGAGGPAIGISFDGTGYGTDGTIWGGEFLIADWKGFERAAHLRTVPMPGGGAAIRNTGRMALAYLITLFGQDYTSLGLPVVERFDERERGVIERQITRALNAPQTSSAGRLFDAVSSMLNIRHEVDYEGQAAIELEMLSHPDLSESYPFEIAGGDRGAEGWVVDTELAIRAIVADVTAGRPVAEIGGRFHNTVAQICLEVCRRLERETGINTVALSGGVFQNVLLVDKLKELLAQTGFTVLTHKQVPTNDGGVSFGQAVIAHHADG